ncbi:phage tail length tape measure family protein [Pararhizobium gei]|uniref:phage tail length tape measure family protein n=1 Tax=Pararhizobium gei TaxID=1395951 RepID=UPI0023DBECD3|nr:phage tail length tape measure family protein [Rhizobium gei]
MTVNLDMVFRADTSAVKPAAEVVKREMDGVANEVADATAALEKHSAALERDADVSRKAAAAANDEKAARDRVNQAMAARPRPTPKAAPSSSPSTLPVQPSGEGAGGPTQKMLDDLRRQYSPRYAALMEYRETVEGIRKANKLGAIGHDEMTAAIGRQRQATLTLLQTQRTQQQRQKGSGPQQLEPWQKTQLAYQANDTVQSLLLGMPIQQVALQQGPQIIQAYGGIGNAMKAAAAAATPLRLAVGGTTAVVLAGSIAWNQYLHSVKEVETAATGLGRSTAGTAASMERAAQAGAAAANISVSAARSMEAQFLRTGRIGSENFEALIGISRDFGATFGLSAEDAGAKLAEMFADPAKAAETLYRQYGLINGATAEYARKLAAQNDLSGAQRVLLDALPSQLADASEATTALGRAWQSVATAASNAWDAIGSGVNAAIEGPTRDERIQELEAARARTSARPVFTLGMGKGIRDRSERDRVELQTLQVERRREQEDAERVRAFYQLRANGAVASGIAEKSPANASPLRRKQLTDDIAAMERRRNVDEMGGVENENIARAIDAKTRALQTLIPEEKRAAEIAALDLRLQTERDPLVRADIAAARTRLQLAGQEIETGKAEAQIAAARKNSLDQAAAADATAREGRNRALDASVERQQFENSLIGKTKTEQERLRQEYELISQVKEDAWARGKKEDTAEILRIREKVAELGRLKAALNSASSRGPLLNSPAADDRDAYLDQSAEQARIRQEAAIRRSSLFARSPQEQAAIARREAELVADSEKDNPKTRKLRIDTAEKEAYERAEKSLTDAQLERGRSLDLTLDSQRLEISLIGATASEAARLRMEYQLTAQVKEDAARNNTKVDEAELARIRLKSAEFGRLAEMQARADLRQNARFELEQLGRTDREQTIASQLQGAGLEVDLASEDAALLRNIEILKEKKKAWEDIRDVGRDAIDQLVDGASSGLDGLADAAESVGKDIVKQLLTLSTANPLKNAVYGDNLPTMESVGGIGGFFGAMLGGKNPVTAAAGQALQSVGSMSVSAGTVMINGAAIGGAADPFKALLGAGPAANNNTQIDLAAQAIKSIESGGNYRALGPVTRNGDRAYGAYQVMGNNVGPWSEATLGRRLSPTEFLNDNSAQDAIFKKYFGGYIDKFGMSGASQAWFGGPGSVGRGGAGADILGTTGTAYVGKFEEALGRATASTNVASQGLGQLGGGLGQFGQTLLSAAGNAAGGGGGLGGLLGTIVNGIGSIFTGGASADPWAGMRTAGPKSFSVGGWTGDGDPREPAGVVHGKEFVVKAPVVARPGVRAFLQALNDNDLPGFSNGGFVPGGSVISYAPLMGGNQNSGRSEPPINVFVENNTGIPIKNERKEERDAHGRRQYRYVLDSMHAANMTEAGSESNRALQSMGLPPMGIRR